MHRVLLALTICALIAAMFGTGCDKITSSIKVPGNVAGQVINAAGQGQGYMSIKLYSADGVQQIDMETSEDTGNFMFSKVPPGKYIIRTFYPGDQEAANDCQPFTLGPGKTLTKTITLTGDAAANGGTE